MLYIVEQCLKGKCSANTLKQIENSSKRVYTDKLLSEYSTQHVFEHCKYFAI